MSLADEKGMFYCRARCVRCGFERVCAWLGYSWVCRGCAAWRAKEVEA